MPTEIRGGQIKDETIDSADIASGSIKAGEISAQAISGQGLITEPHAANDRLLILDATDSSLKQVASTNLFVESGTAIGIGTGPDGPDNTLHVKSPGTTHIKIESEAGYEAAVKMNAGSSSTYMWTPGNTSDIRFYAGGADRMHIDNDGNVGIGTTTPGSGLDVAHSISLPVGTLRTSNYSITADDFCIVGDCNSSAFTLTLPSATDAMAGRIYTIKRMDSGNSGGGNMLTISRNGKNIDNFAGDLVLANLDAVVLQCIGALGGWIRIGQYLAPL